MPSPTPILNSSVIVLVKYFASVAEACDNNSKMIEILRLVDLEPLIFDSFCKLSNTKLMVNGCEKKVIWDFLEYNFMHARPMSPSSRTASSTFACVVPTASATALSTSFAPIPISSELHAGKTPPKSNNPTFPMVSASNISLKIAFCYFYCTIFSAHCTHFIIVQFAFITICSWF